MVDSPKESSVVKRKASLSPPPDDVTPKRVKVEDGGSHSNGTHNHDHVHVQNGNSVDEKYREAVNGSASNQQEDEARADHKDADTQPRDADRAVEDSEDSEAAVRLASEARRPSDVGAPASGRRNFSQEEKKRGQRLFGGLLNTLSQTTASSLQKKRLEIERRQQDRVQQQRVEDDKHRAEKLSKLKHTRKVEQVKFDEQVVCRISRGPLAKAFSKLG
jgi:hypothetical protein